LSKQYVVHRNESNLTLHNPIRHLHFKNVKERFENKQTNRILFQLIDDISNFFEKRGLPQPFLCLPTFVAMCQGDRMGFLKKSPKM
jgi:hypothetical protein